MGNQASKAASGDRTPSDLVCEPQRIDLCNFSTSQLPDGKSTLTFWECRTCGQRYVDPAAPSFFISPPPTTECITIKTDETRGHAVGGVASISISGGATCDYVRLNSAVGAVDLSRQIVEPVEAASAVDIPGLNELSAPACDKAPLKVVGEHGRVSRQNAAVDTACDEEDPEDCEFWRAPCNDTDCIYEGGHCRYLCAMAELDEEPKAEAPVLKRGFVFGRSAT
ncbi:MAG: hypothetical protein Q9161_002146 [Pseudevernia consocians]